MEFPEKIQTDGSTMLPLGGCTSDCLCTEFEYLPIMVFRPAHHLNFLQFIHLVVRTELAVAQLGGFIPIQC